MTDNRDDGGPAHTAPFYTYKPSIAGAPWTFRLGPTALEWNSGYRAGRIVYDKIARIRLLYRPGTIQMRRYQAEIRGEGAKLALASTSFTGLVAQQAQDGEYSRFLVELHRRVAMAGGRPALNAGSPPLLYWPGAAIIAASAVGFLLLIARALRDQTMTNALIFIAFGAVFFWQGWQFFYLNRPRGYRLDALPDELLPKPLGR
jgi:hypothetical protein